MDIVQPILSLLENFVKVELYISLLCFIYLKKCVMMMTMLILVMITAVVMVKKIMAMF